MEENRPGGLTHLLPRVKASPGFTSEVMRSVRRERDAGGVNRTALLFRMAATVAVAACILAGVQLALVDHAHRQRIAALRSEQQKIEAELEAVKRIARETEPVVVLENGQGTRVIMDLDSPIQQTSLRTYD